MGRAYLIGTGDTKGEELRYLQRLLQRQGLDCLTVDVGTRSRGSSFDVGPRQVAQWHPEGAEAVFLDRRGPAVSAMGVALRRFLASRTDIGGLLGLGGSGGTAMIAPALRDRPVGVPKLLVSTVASGNTAAYVDVSDLVLFPAVTDIAGLNRISRIVLANAAHALAGMMRESVTPEESEKRAVGLTMFGVTTPCVQLVVAALERDFDPVVFHATGVGSRAMESLVDSGLIAALIDVSTTEVADFLVGGIMSAGEDRMGAAIRRPVPYVGSCGALDMVNFGPMASVPANFRSRLLLSHNEQVTLMRTTAEECAAFGDWMAQRLNRMRGPVRFLLPEGGLSQLDAPGQPFHDPAARKALFAALERRVMQTEARKLLRVPHHINDPAFAHCAVAAFREVMAG